MEITNIEIQLMDPDRESRLLAFASITLDDCFVIHDLRIIRNYDQDEQGNRKVKNVFVAMPCTKQQTRCWYCHRKNSVLAEYCNWCGSELDPNKLIYDSNGERKSLFIDICHPINSETRWYIQNAVLDAYRNERAKDYLVSGEKE